MSRDEVFLRHILDEARFLGAETGNLDLTGFKENAVLQKACLRSLEVIGEAVKNLSSGLKERNPQVDWKRMAGLRDKLIHHYFGVDVELVWDVISSKVPGLEGEIGKILGEVKNSNDP